jgi:hypothetical protein
MALSWSNSRSNEPKSKLGLPLFACSKGIFSPCEATRRMGR